MFLDMEGITLNWAFLLFYDDVIRVEELVLILQPPPQTQPIDS